MRGWTVENKNWRANLGAKKWNQISLQNRAQRINRWKLCQRSWEAWISASSKVHLMVHQSLGSVWRNKIEVNEGNPQVNDKRNNTYKRNELSDQKVTLCAEQDEISQICTKLWHFGTLEIKNAKATLENQSRNSQICHLQHCVREDNEAKSEGKELLRGCQAFKMQAHTHTHTHTHIQDRARPIAYSKELPLLLVEPWDGHSFSMWFRDEERQILSHIPGTLPESP